MAVRSTALLTGAEPGACVTVLERTTWIMDARADGAGDVHLYDLAAGTFHAQAEDGATWRVVVDDAGSATVTKLGGGATPPGLYLHGGRRKAAQTPPPGARLIAYLPGSPPGGACAPYPLPDPFHADVNLCEAIQE